MVRIVNEFGHYNRRGTERLFAVDNVIFVQDKSPCVELQQGPLAKTLATHLIGGAERGGGAWGQNARFKTRGRTGGKDLRFKISLLCLFYALLAP